MANENDYEFSFTFHKTNKFWVELNKLMVIKDRDTLNEGGLYHLLLFSKLPSNFNNCIDERGCLKSSQTGMEQITTGFTDVEFHLGVKWLDDGENGFSLFLDEWEDEELGENEEPVIVDVEIPIDDDVVLYPKGVALAKKVLIDGNDKDYIVAWARASTEAKAQNYISIMGGSAFVGHKSCKEA